MEGQLDFFSQQLTPHSLAASQACAAAASSQQSGSVAAVDPGNQCQVTLSMLRSYKLPNKLPKRETAAKAASAAGGEGAMEQGRNSQTSCHDGWAPGAPWDRFVNHGDPVGMPYGCAKHLPCTVLWNNFMCCMHASMDATHERRFAVECFDSKPLLCTLGLQQLPKCRMGTGSRC